MISKNQLCLVYDNLSNILKNINNGLSNIIIYSDDIDEQINEIIIYKYKSLYILEFKNILKKIVNNKLSYIKNIINIIPKEIGNIIKKYYENDILYVIFHNSSYDNHIIRSRLIDKYLEYNFPNRKIIVILMENNVLMDYHRLIKWKDKMSFTLPIYK